MKTLKTLPAAPLLLILVFSCHKEEQYVTHENTTVEGVLLSAADRSPIAEGKVLLLSDERGQWGDAIWYGRSYDTRNVLTTDAQGRFSYSFKHSDDTIYAIAAEAGGFFPNINSGGYDYPNWRASGLGGVKRGYKNFYDRPDDDKDFLHNKGVVHYPEIRLAPKGWIKFQIINEPPAFESDVLKLGGEGAGGQLTSFTGANVNSIHVRGPLRAGRFVYVGYNVTSQGSFKYYEDSIFIEPHDTALYELNY